MTDDLTTHISSAAQLPVTRGISQALVGAQTQHCSSHQWSRSQREQPKAQAPDILLPLPHKLRA